ncbi:aldo/keto reductase [Methylocapsa sp. S129]|uniref:aldo/keto reductase n=1 Tax=Methylocapsa sp. S129 TaxID=1641869 RepID=UPI00131B87FE|nr:aldo/keto reductase [Methylocapsa sp. S129]
MSAIAQINLRPDYEITRVIRGGWQLAGGHGPIDREAAIDDLVAAFDSGVTTFDCADIYTGVEELIGAFRARVATTRGTQAARSIHIHTKLVPDLATLESIDKAYVERIVDRALKRLRMERLDLVQFHWWRYAAPGMMDVIGWLDEFRRAGKIRHVGLTNFDTAHLREVLLSGVDILSVQTQYSVLDGRPGNGVAALCEEYGVWLLCYGSVAGGFLSDRWLGAPEPVTPLENRSLVKYKLIIDDFGGWDLFQELLRALRRVADRHAVDIATIASRYVLDRPRAAAVIVGARNRAHVDDNARIMAIALSDADEAEISPVTARATGPLGDCYELERDLTGRHGSIMHYNNNAKT